MVRWVVCGLAAGLWACTMPNNRFKLDDSSSTGAAETTGQDAASGAESGDSSGDPPPATTADLPGSTSTDALGTTSGTTTTSGTSGTTLPETTAPDLTTTAPDLTTTGEDTTTAGESSSGGEAGPCQGACGTPGCGDCPGGDMVAFPGFAIDARETSNAEYQQFLAVAHDMTMQPEACAWNDDFAPAQPPGDDALPVVGIDWCDARAYCAWAGKRLCGAIDGGPAAISQVVDPTTNQWYRACSNGDGRRYPYGQGYQTLACNGADGPFDDLLPVGTLPTCEAPVAGLFDLSGNVWEWVDSCDGDGPDAACLRRGGSFYSHANELRCDLLSKRPRATAVHYVGVRCCSL